MAINDDFCNPLIAEVLTDAAGTFFGRRCRVDEMKELFESSYRELTASAEKVRGRAGLLNRLLSPEGLRGAFFERIGVDAGAFGTSAEYHERDLPLSLPFALTLSGRYYQLVLYAYDRLQKACDTYLYGPPESVPPGSEDVGPYLGMVREMGRLVNEAVDRVNAEASPGCVLQFARQFDPEGLEKERATGGFSSTVDCSIDQKLRIARIDLSAYPMTAFPDLPRSRKKEREIREFCDRAVRDHRREIQDRVGEMAARIKANQR